MAAEIRIRAATEADLPELLRLQEASPQAAQWPAGALLDGLSGCSVAEVGDQVAGFLLSRKLPGGEREILNLAVDPSCRRQGVGQRLLREFLSCVEGSVYLEVRQSNTAAQALYKRFGFESVAVRRGYYHQPVENGIVMKRAASMGFKPETAD